MILKPTLELPNGKIKGNVDAELVLHSMIQYSNYSGAILVSGDGDFYCLAEYLEQNNKLLRLIVPNRTYSQLLKRYAGYIVRVDQLRGSLEYIK
ncbi:MAG: NYN domain-containing protein [Anaerolineae bacterium]|nr:NYN domain-containing protein [Anaerolineae bacterium]